MKRKLNTVAFEGVGKEIYERNGMTVHGSSATNPRSWYSVFYSLVNMRLYFSFLLIVMRGKGGVGTPTLTTLFGDAKKRKKPYSAQEHHFISNRKLG